MEIEKKFTVKRMPENLDDCKYADIEQGYLLRGPVVRVRRWNDDYILTYKQKTQKPDSGTIVNIEEEFPLNKEGFYHLLEKCDGNIIKKRRYLVPLNDGLIAELDVFDGYLKGLVFAEVEFKSVEQAESFILPDWFDKDVTKDKRYSNGHLSQVSSFDEL